MTVFILESKIQKVLVLIFTLIILVSCENTDSSGSNYNFIDQPLQGKFSGADWTFVSGTAETGTFDTNEWDFDLYNITYVTQSPFDTGAYPAPYKKLMFSIDKIPETGNNILNFDFSNQDNIFTVTFYDTDTNLNTIAANGAVEILSIDANNISGRMHVWSHGDEANFEVNGNFTVPHN